MASASAEIRLKRVYDEPSPHDGARILVDRLWPRGLTKQAAHLQSWLRDLAPSNELRKWYHARPEEWGEFRRRYGQELQRPAAAKALDELYQLTSREKRVTLLFASKNLERNNATVLKEVLEGRKKPASAAKFSEKIVIRRQELKQ